MNAARLAALAVAITLLAACAKEHEVTLPSDGRGSDEVYRINTSHVPDRPYLVEGRPFSGVVVARRNGQVVLRAQMRDGRKHGVQEQFYADGKLQRREKVAWDEKDGARYIGDSEGWCENGERSSLTEHDRKGKIRLEKRWDCETGKLVAEAKFDDAGKPDGEARTWTPEGKLIEQVAWKAGVRNGDKKLWTPEGTLVEHARYREGEKHGVQEAWHANGKQASRGEYADGRPIGRHEAWAEDGRLLEGGSYAANGEKTGMWLEQHGGGSSSSLHYGPDGFVPAELLAAYASALQPPRSDAQKVAFYLSEGGVKLGDALPTSYGGGPVQGRYEFPVRSWTYPVVIADIALLPLLLEKGADINQADSDGATRLLHCAKDFRTFQDGGNSRCLPADLQLVLDKGAKGEIKDINGRNALHYLLDIRSYDDVGSWNRDAGMERQARVDALHWLVKAGADVNAADAEGWTPLVRALRARRLDLVKPLLAAGARGDGPGPGDSKAVHWVFLDETHRYNIQGDFVAEALPLLVAAGADANAPLNWDGRPVTLRELAVRHGLIDVVRVIEQNAKPAKP